MFLYFNHRNFKIGIFLIHNVKKKHSFEKYSEHESSNFWDHIPRVYVLMYVWINDYRNI